MLLAHISDTHFRSRGEKLYGFIDVNAANADVVSQLNALRERPDAVVVSGDIVNCGRPEEYQVARRDPRQPELSAVSDPRQPRRQSPFSRASSPAVPAAGQRSAKYALCGG